MQTARPFATITGKEFAPAAHATGREEVTRDRQDHHGKGDDQDNHMACVREKQRAVQVFEPKL